jgi:uncharacterized metal-binding protein YceD (DUF177 family)
MPDAPRDSHTQSLPFPVRSLSPRKPTRFTWRPDAATLAQLAETLGITAVRDLRFAGEIRPLARHDLALEATLEATVEQPCGITLAPVRTRIAERVTRRYLADWQEPTGTEVEIPEDDTSEALPDVIDAAAVALYPRAPGAELGAVQHTEPGQTPLTDDAVKPFAGLAALKDRMEKP